MMKVRPAAAYVVDTRGSPKGTLLPLPLASVRLDGFLGGWQKVNRESSLPHGYAKLVETGVISNFEAAAGRRKAGFQGAMFFSDTDLYKWLEAACFDLANHPDDALGRQVEDAVRLIGDAQMPDGYINTFFQLTGIAERWKLLEKHEMYCIGHLTQAAVAHHRVTGSEDLLRVARRAADHVDSIFGPGRRPGCPGHPEIEMALVELYRVTGEKRYLDLARFLLGNRGKGYVNGTVMYGDHRDAIGVSEPQGHAVMQLYLLCGITDAWLETGEQILYDTVACTWHDMATRKIAITGGVGVRPKGEAFGASYELPNEGTYNETCAQIASVMWCWRMLLATGEVKYADLMERTIYNGVLSGVALDGKSFFYGNGLLSRSGGKRSAWDKCACCPPNVMRTLASVNGYVATTSSLGLQVHLYESCGISADLAEGPVALSVASDYPWDGRVVLTVERSPAAPWELSLRIPGWCANASVSINSRKREEALPPGTPAVLRREWRAGDTVVLELPMEPVIYEAHPYIDSTRSSAAIARGPLVYCIEGHDQPAGVLDCRVDPAGAMRAEKRTDLLRGVTVIKAPGFSREGSEWEGVLYRKLASAGRRTGAGKMIELVAVPYYAWANRGPSPMRVWIPM